MCSSSLEGFWCHKYMRRQTTYSSFIGRTTKATCQRSHQRCYALPDGDICRCTQVPLYPPTVVYIQLMAETRSRINACADRVGTGVSRLHHGCSAVYASIKGVSRPADHCPVISPRHCLSSSRVSSCISPLWEPHTMRVTVMLSLSLHPRGSTRPRALESCMLNYVT
jgi:hypothetical protein